MSKTILAVGAHIGDMELTCGALLAANAVHGGRSVTLALTAGEKGAPAGADVAEYRKSKISEAEAFAAELGGEAIVLGYPDGLLPDNDEARFTVCDVIRRVKPDILITHHAHSMHKDHAACREGFEPYVYLDVSDGFALWEKAIEHHWFAVHSTSFPYKEYYSHLKRLRGIEGRKGYCECFMIPAEQMRIVKKLEDE